MGPPGFRVLCKQRLFRAPDRIGDRTGCTHCTCAVSNVANGRCHSVTTRAFTASTSASASRFVPSAAVLGCSAVGTI